MKAISRSSGRKGTVTKALLAPVLALFVAGGVGFVGSPSAGGRCPYPFLPGCRITRAAARRIVQCSHSERADRVTRADEETAPVTPKNRT
jgi:hypothetical protein